MPDFVATDDGWLLPVTGLTVTQCRIDYAFTVVLAADSGSVEIRIEQPFSVSTDDLEYLIDPEDAGVKLAPALMVLRQEIARATASKSGSLELIFANSSSLRVATAADYEAWSLVGPDGLRMVSLPGGDVAIWNGEPSGDRAA